MNTCEGSDRQGARGRQGCTAVSENIWRNILRYDGAEHCRSALLKRAIIGATAAVLCFSTPCSAADASLDVRGLDASAVVSFSQNPARRIVSLSPAATEILCAVGARNQIAARTDLCDFPADVKTIPSVGGFDGKTLSIEKIISFRPDLVYATYGMHDYLVKTLKSYGIQVYISDASSVREVIAEITDMGKITGHADGAATVCAHITAVIDAVHARVAGKKVPSVYWEIWNSPYMSAGKNSFMNDLIIEAGGTNIFSALDQAYPLVSEESIIARAPDVIIIPDMEKETRESVQRRSGWSAIPAVTSGRITFINADITARPGPRITDAVLLLARAIHPDVDFSGIQ